MTLVVAILLVVFKVVQGWWAIALVVGAGLFEASQNVFWLWNTQRRTVQVGAETLIGRTVEVADECRPVGHIRVAGELWQAHCAEGAGRGDRVRVVGRDGLTLEVERAAG